MDEVKKYLAAQNQSAWSEEIALMVEMHHKIRAYGDDRFPLVEVFRKGDLVDFSLGAFRCGVPGQFVREVKRAIPNAGFHRFLLKGAKDWFLRHPLSMPPFMRW